eukprot:7390998-Prymnesium_polylepis.1
MLYESEQMMQKLKHAGQLVAPVSPAEHTIRVCELSERKLMLEKVLKELLMRADADTPIAD